MNLYQTFVDCSHTIISGSTGSGKSFLINGFLYRLFRYTRPEYFELWIIDPKRVDYIEYKPFCKEYETTIAGAERLLEKAVNRMECRYRLLEKECSKKWAGSHIFILIDEFGQILKDKKCIALLDNILRLGRAARIHVIAANQSASKAVGCPAHLRVNFTNQIALHCMDRIASRQAIGYPGAENLPLYGYCYGLTPGDVAPVLYKIEPVPDEKIKEVLKAVKKYKRKKPR